MGRERQLQARCGDALSCVYHQSYRPLLGQHLATDDSPYAEAIIELRLPNSFELPQSIAGANGINAGCQSWLVSLNTM